MVSTDSSASRPRARLAQVRQRRVAAPSRTKEIARPGSGDSNHAYAAG